MSVSETQAPDPRRDTQRERGLVRAAVYDRVVRASRERVWENVLDWEHLPWLHAGSFSSIACQDAGSWGWRARIGLNPPGSQHILLELVIEPDVPRYVSRTLEGNGAGNEIWTHVAARGPDETAVTVEFWLRDVTPAQQEALGRGFVQLYTQLWDEDEEMMIVRERELRAVRAREAGAAAESTGASPVVLGTEESLERKLPCVVSYAGRRFRLLRDAGKLVVHSVVCPHALGPLGDAAVEEGRITCPWHGYAFDVATGRECTGRRLRLAPAPQISVDSQTGQLVLGA